MHKSYEVFRDRKAFLSLHRRLWWRRTNLFYQYGLSPLWVGTIAVIAYNYTGSFAQWFVIIMCSAILLQPIASYSLTMHRARLRVRRSGDERVIYTFADDFLGISDSVGKIELLWDGINSVIKFDQAWVLGFPRDLDIIVSAGILESDVKALIESKLQQAGANHKPIRTPRRSIDY